MEQCFLVAVPLGYFVTFGVLRGGLLASLVIPRGGASKANHHLGPRPKMFLFPSVVGPSKLDLQRQETKIPPYGRDDGLLLAERGGFEPPIPR